MGVPKPPVSCLCAGVYCCLSVVKHLYSVPRLFCTSEVLFFLFIDHRHTVRGNRNPYQVLCFCVHTTIDSSMYVIFLFCFTFGA